MQGGGAWVTSFLAPREQEWCSNYRAVARKANFIRFKKGLLICTPCVEFFQEAPP